VQKNNVRHWKELIYFVGSKIHFVFESRVVIALSSSSRAPGVFLSFLTSVLMAFSHSLLWFRSAFECVLFKIELVELAGDIDAIELDSPLVVVVVVVVVAVDGDDTDVVSYGFTLKPSNFLTMAGVIHKFEKWVVNIDILVFC